MKKILLYIIVFIFSTFYGNISVADLAGIALRFNAPTGIAFDSAGAMYVTNWSDDSVVKVKVNGERETVYSNISSPAGIVIDVDDNIYVSSYSDNYILKIAKNGQSQKISQGYHTPTGMALSNSGKLLITNRSTGEIVSLDFENGQKTTIARGLVTPVGVTQLPDNSLVVSQYSGHLTLIQPNGDKTEIGEGFNRPGVGIVTISPSEVAVIDNGANMLRKIDVKTKVLTTLFTSLPSAVALAYHNNRFYIGTWGDNSVYIFNDN
ncbi:Vgb family protein [Gilliamella sp. Bif1-4]|jgi:glucose/arabinose dehydrogenase|uniref:Vgb family protein n=1 Tax=Gilliamella sp. Bif1-4 TaxID=3120233 RepID=UPI00080E50B8|nr:hypothetical protein [Gilliamella apicola]OCG39894.1 hypothetical protein A9G25_10960 [Gilliamella apicola]